MLGIYDGPKLEGDIYPEKAVLTDEEWEQIMAFYLKAAPEKLASGDAQKINVGIKNFQLVRPEMQFSPPSTTLIHLTEENELFIADTHTELLVNIDEDLKVKQAAKIGHGAVHLEEFEHHHLVTVMGSFSPADVHSGFIVQLPKDGRSAANVVIDSLNRPVHASYHDFNFDGLQDILVSEYGKWKGQLNLYINNGAKGFKKETLIDQTGPIKAVFKDLDQDGLQDIICLFGQGNEGIYALYNNGDLSFRKEVLVKLSPSHGSTYFDLRDFDEDGDLDIIYTAGDNADFPPVLKPYHGIYIYANDGKNHFKEQFFYPMNGAYKAIPFDFDDDGDLDIAAISFFPDWSLAPNESFLYLENTTNGYHASTFAEQVEGRWISIEIGDYDRDGDVDIFLGSLAFEVLGRRGLTDAWAESGLPFVVLSNQKLP